MIKQEVIDKIEELAQPILEIMNQEFNPHVSITIADGMLIIKENIAGIIYNKGEN